MLTDADHYVLKYLESEADQIPSHTLESLRNRLGVHPDQGTATNPPDEEHGRTQYPSRSETLQRLQLLMILITIWGYEIQSPEPRFCLTLMHFSERKS